MIYRALYNTKMWWRSNIYNYKNNIIKMFYYLPHFWHIAYLQCTLYIIILWSKKPKSVYCFNAVKYWKLVQNLNIRKKTFLHFSFEIFALIINMPYTNNSRLPKVVSRSWKIDFRFHVYSSTKYSNILNNNNNNWQKTNEMIYATHRPQL